MTHRKLVTALIVLACVASLAAANPEKDGKKLDDQLKKISLVASDGDGRRVVNRVMARELGVPRKELVEERKSTQFVYGQIFAVHEIARQTNSSFAEIAKEMTGGKSPLAISLEKNVDLKKILKDAKKFNSRLERELTAVAAGDESEMADDLADGYDPGGDAQLADTAGFTPAEVSQARQYVRQPPGLAARGAGLDSQSSLIRGGGAGAGANASAMGAAASSQAHGSPAPPARGGGPH